MEYKIKNCCNARFFSAIQAGLGSHLKTYGRGLGLGFNVFKLFLFRWRNQNSSAFWGESLAFGRFKRQLSQNSFGRGCGRFVVSLLVLRQRLGAVP